MNIIKKSTEFQHTFKAGSWYSADILMTYILKNNLEFNRVGVAVGKKVFNRSTKRNRIKRLLREAYRLNEKTLKTGYDIVIVFKSGIEYSSITFEMVNANLVKCFNKANLLQITNDTIKEENKC